MTDPTPHTGKVYIGVTTDAYVKAAAIKRGGGAVFLIRNTHASKTLKYKATIVVNSDPAAVEHEVVSEQTLSPAETYTVVTGINVPFYVAYIYVINGDGASSYNIQTGRYS